MPWKMYWLDPPSALIEVWSMDQCFRFIPPPLTDRERALMEAREKILRETSIRLYRIRAGYDRNDPNRQADYFYFATSKKDARWKFKATWLDIYEVECLSLEEALKIVQQPRLHMISG